jgi:chemosensory pili system protein ChpA (sensor histidine kinase/response regulator)
MSAIAAQIEEIKGIIEIDSQPGQGCCVEFRVPESLLSVGGLLITLQGHTAGISSRGLQRVAMIEAGEISVSDGSGPHAPLDGQSMPLFRIESLLYGDKVNAELPTTGEAPVLVIRAGDINALVMVGSIVATRALLIRRPGLYLEGFPALFGTTTLSDGSVVAVLDIVELLRTPPNWQPSVPAATPAAIASGPQAWIIDDSAAVRREIAAQTAAVGYAVRLSGSGAEAIEQLSLPPPALVIVDADMPGISGIEICRRMRTDARFRTVPIVVLSARGEACREAARAAGATLLLPKPCPRPILQRMLERYPVPTGNRVLDATGDDAPSHSDVKN